jgi:hypothetical protein
MSVQIQWRRDTAANWTSNNPTLGEGEAGLETDSGKWKMGDGVTAWTSLPYRGTDNVRVANSAPGSPAEGDVYVDSVTNALYVATD